MINNESSGGSRTATTFVKILIICFIIISSLYGQKSNILFILTDDQSKIDMGVYRNSLLETPNMDQLAKEKVILH